MKKKLSIAVTGSIGSGKSTFCKLLSEEGYPIINADELAKDILISDKSVKAAVIKHFGSNSYDGDKLNQKYIAEKVFSDAGNVIFINNIVHPVVKLKIEDLVKKYQLKFDIVFTEAALIYEAEMEDMFDYVVLITASKDLRKKRKSESNALSEDDFEKRNDNQIPDEEKKKQADFVFVNDSTIENLKSKADLLIKLVCNA